MPGVRITRKSRTILLVTVLDKFTVKTWQIYYERGGISFKIKFANNMINDNGGGLPTGLHNVCYTKKFPSKQAINQKRYVNHHITHRIT